MMSQQPQQQQHQPQQQQCSVSLQPQPTTSYVEEEEEFRTHWIGNLQNWMDKVEEEEEEVRTLWIGDLQHWMDEAYIDSCFAHTGEVFTSKVIPRNTGKSSYGFILFKSHAIAERILHRFNGTPMPRVPLGTSCNFSLNWAPAKLVVTDGTTTTTTITTTTGQCEVVNCMFCSTTILPPGPGDLKISTVGRCDNSSWEDMLKWWSLSQLEGTCTAHSVRATHRVYEIADFLFIPVHTPPWESKCRTPGEAVKVEELLDELQSYADSINLAFQLHLMDALEPLLRSMSCSHAGVRARAGKIVCSMVQNNPRGQQLVMEARGEVLLLDAIICADDATPETTVLDTISSLFGNNIHGPAFRQRNGYAYLNCSFLTSTVNCQRRALFLIHRLVSEHESDCKIVTGLGYHRFMMELAFSYCASVRVAALKCLLLLTQVEGGGKSHQLVKNDNKLKQVLKQLIKQISAMAREDLVATREEIQLVDSLWNACYNMPSSVRGLLVTHEEASALGSPSAATESFLWSPNLLIPMRSK